MFRGFYFLSAVIFLVLVDFVAIAQAGNGPEGMVWIPGGTFQMGGAGPEARRNELPVHAVRVDGYWMDATEVTNAQFRAFVTATGYVTTAEKAPLMEDVMKQLPPGTPPPDPALLKPGSLVFVPPAASVPLDDVSGWWHWVHGADWRHPRGPGSSIDGLDGHPVVQISWDDAVAYCNWAGKRLPTEAEWEFAARGGLSGKRYLWGDDGLDEKKPQANVWEGDFPVKNTALDGFAWSAPVMSFPANPYGLYDMAGNVWEWCLDWYRADAYAQTAQEKLLVNPAGPDTSFDPDEPFTPKRSIRGGSFMCHASYCLSYRPSARRGEAVDTGTSNIGFRCVMSEDAWRKKQAK
jgi:sulfatase modifying factor 1